MKNTRNMKHTMRYDKVSITQYCCRMETN